MNPENAPAQIPEIRKGLLISDLPIMKYFKYQHLPNHLKEVSKPFCDLAETINQYRYRSAEDAEIVAGLRKLLEAKDCIVRTMLTSIR